MRALISIVIILAVVAMLTIDGLGMYAAHRTAVEVAEAAAEQAAQAFTASRGDAAAAERVVEGIGREAQVQIVSAGYHQGSTRWYEVTVSAQPKSYFLEHLPRLKGYLVQESTAIVHF